VPRTFRRGFKHVHGRPRPRTIPHDAAQQQPNTPDTRGPQLARLVHEQTDWHIYDHCAAIHTPYGDFNATTSRISWTSVALLPHALHDLRRPPQGHHDSATASGLASFLETRDGSAYSYLNENHRHGHSRTALCGGTPYSSSATRSLRRQNVPPGSPWASLGYLGHPDECHLTQEPRSSCVPGTIKSGVDHRAE